MVCFTSCLNIARGRNHTKQSLKVLLCSRLHFLKNGYKIIPLPHVLLEPCYSSSKRWSPVLSLALNLGEIVIALQAECSWGHFAWLIVAKRRPTASIWFSSDDCCGGSQTMVADQLPWYSCAVRKPKSAPMEQSHREALTLQGKRECQPSSCSSSHCSNPATVWLWARTISWTLSEFSTCRNQER